MTLEYRSESENKPPRAGQEQQDSPQARDFLLHNFLPQMCTQDPPFSFWAFQSPAPCPPTAAWASSQGRPMPAPLCGLHSTSPRPPCVWPVPEPQREPGGPHAQPRPQTHGRHTPAGKTSPTGTRKRPVPIHRGCESPTRRTHARRFWGWDPRSLKPDRPEHMVSSPLSLCGRREQSKQMPAWAHLQASQWVPRPHSPFPGSSRRRTPDSPPQAATPAATLTRLGSKGTNSSADQQRKGEKKLNGPFPTWTEMRIPEVNARCSPGSKTHQVRTQHLSPEARSEMGKARGRSCLVRSLPAKAKLCHGERVPEEQHRHTPPMCCRGQ